MNEQYWQLKDDEKVLVAALRVNKWVLNKQYVTFHSTYMLTGNFWEFFKAVSRTDNQTHYNGKRPKV